MQHLPPHSLILRRSRVAYVTHSLPCAWHEQPWIVWESGYPPRNIWQGLELQKHIVDRNMNIDQAKNVYSCSSTF